MNFFAFLLLVLVGPFCEEVKSENLFPIYNAKGYFWRDYNGELPEDAFRAGKDKEGKTLYIGQVLDNRFLIPGQIKEMDKKIYYDYRHTERTATENVKIFCTHYPEQYHWIKTSAENFASLDKNLLVIGGFHATYETFIGRITSEDETTVGKVVIGHGRTELHITKSGFAMDYEQFEVLAYDPKDPVVRTRNYFIRTSDGNPPQHCETNPEAECPCQIININIL